MGVNVCKSQSVKSADRKCCNQRKRKKNPFTWFFDVRIRTPHIQRVYGFERQYIIMAMTLYLGNWLLYTCETTCVTFHLSGFDQYVCDCTREKSSWNPTVSCRRVREKNTFYRMNYPEFQTTTTARERVVAAIRNRLSRASSVRICFGCLGQSIEEATVALICLVIWWEKFSCWKTLNDQSNGCSTVMYFWDGDRPHRKLAIQLTHKMFMMSQVNWREKKSPTTP